MCGLIVGERIDTVRASFFGWLGLPPVYGADKHPLPWLREILNGVEHANFFEARATEYSKGATQGDWHGADGVWAQFDSWKQKQTG